MKVEVKKVVLKIGDKEIGLSVDEAKELTKLLMDTFGEKEPIKYYERVPWYPYYPYYEYHPITFTSGDWTTTQTGNSIVFASNTNAE